MPAFVIALLLLSCGLSGLLRPASAESLQAPMKENNMESVRDILKKAEIIPTVIDDFNASITVEVSWKNANAELGNTISPNKLQSAPSISLHSTQETTTTNSNFVLALTDPDAPSRKKPKWSEICHWIAANLSLASSTSPAQDDDVRQKADDLVPYKPPGPPPKTGKHRYVFLAFQPANGTSSSLNLTAPSERQHWGTGKKEHGVRDWAKENGLVPVGANFIYSQNAEQ